MLFKVIFYIFLQYRFVFSYLHQKPIAKEIWQETCKPHEKVLNDCNWCRCERGQFVCSARVCSEVDMFGHFNDAVREYLVGMEGHGSWRSDKTACQPRAHYTRHGLLCVCDDDGNWPNPVCRDLFRVMHEVELTGHMRPSALHECTPQRLYLYGCNLCFCPPEGRIDPASCTQHNCSDSDPVLLSNQVLDKKEASYNLTEVYAECDLNRKYIIGCRKCICLKNNRLLCDNCNRTVDTWRSTDEEENYCDKYGTEHVFNIDCNICICDERSKMYCTTKKCLKDSMKPSLASKSEDLTLRSVRRPVDALECVLGTKYRVDCNTCFCTQGSDGRKSLSCTLKLCKVDPRPYLLERIKGDCVENTVYEVDCVVCRCDVVDGVKRETCVMASPCSEGKVDKPSRPDLDALHGYCEPAHIYQKACNTCRCLSDGKVAVCTAKVCAKQEPPLVVDIIPVTQRGAAPCPADHMYKVDCNYCFCLKNGNFLCTTAVCGN